jgi:hypothetical protein
MPVPQRRPGALAVAARAGNVIAEAREKAKSEEEDHRLGLLLAEPVDNRQNCFAGSVADLEASHGCDPWRSRGYFSCPTLTLEVTRNFTVVAKTVDNTLM